MQNKIIELLQNKKIAILGFGLEGKSTYNFIRKHLPNKELTIIDQKDISNSINDSNVTIISGDNYLENLNQFDLIIKTPGISLKDIDTTKIKDKIYSQLELLLEVNAKNVIGITGTKGKSTTTTLIYNVIKEQNNNTYLAGNIGIPIFDEIDKFNEDTIIVVEMSSHQLEFVRKSPHIGIILNLYQDHLDHAGSVEHYHECKLHMFDYQNENDIAIYCSDNSNLNNIMKNKDYKQKIYKIQKEYNENYVSLKDNKVYYKNEILYIDDNKRNLLGIHNLENIMIVSLIAKILNLNLEKAKKTIDEFKGLEHRLELVGKYNNIIYYNDTIATIPEATISGIEALQNVNTLIFGGMDRGIDYTPLINYLNKNNVENLICMPETGYKIGKQLENTNKNIFYAETLDEAVKIAKRETKKETICLLSPAAPSYNYFKNYIEKGNKYKELIKKEID
ncbi:MAG: UDP-N-acetylmuramoyl-L-alanine--D-glutamate ligase [Candidatus Coprovivens sp.]